jgi:hypothetical protein
MRTIMFAVQCAAGQICHARIEACRDLWYDDIDIDRNSKEK